MVTEPNNPSPPSRELSERQVQVLEHLRLFRVSTTAVIRRLYFPANATAEAVESFIARLRRRRYIRSATLIGQEDYYWITAVGLREVFSENVSRSGVGGYALVDCYGRLMFCTASPDTRKKLSWRDFEERYPLLRHPRERQHQFFIDKEEGPPRLGLIHVDGGVRVERLVRKLQHQVLGRLLAEPVWRTQVIDAERLTVALVTTTDERLAQVREALDPSQWARIRFRFEVVPELRVLINRRAVKSKGARGRRSAKKDDQETT